MMILATEAVRGICASTCDVGLVCSSGSTAHAVLITDDQFFSDCRLRLDANFLRCGLGYRISCNGSAPRDGKTFTLFSSGPSDCYNFLGTAVGDWGPLGARYACSKSHSDCCATASSSYGTIYLKPSDMVRPSDMVEVVVPTIDGGECPLNYKITSGQFMGRPESNSTIYIIVGAVFAAILLLLVCAAAWVYRKRKRHVAAAWATHPAPPTQEPHVPKQQDYESIRTPLTLAQSTAHTTTENSTIGAQTRGRPTVISMNDLLAQAKLAHYESALNQAGLLEAEDVLCAEDSELQEYGLKKAEVKRLRRTTKRLGLARLT